LNACTRLVLIGTKRLPTELDMKIEHVAFNVPDPLAMGRWYVEHLGMQVKRRTVDPPYAHFLADDSGTVMIEIYGNDDAPVPDYATLHPMSLHLAFVAKDMTLDIKRLTTAGAELILAPQTAPNGDVHAMLRDPWGFVIQLVARAKPMV
jgi:catechol 2,3-dioxygenase-like lactoylglutathione lyase family enzyme